MAKVRKAWLVPVFGEIKRLPELEGKELELKPMYQIIGNKCHLVERVALAKGVDMWVDEEGLLKENITNPVATYCYQNARKDIDRSELLVVGNVIIIDNTKKGDYIIDHAADFE